MLPARHREVDEAAEREMTRKAHGGVNVARRGTCLFQRRPAQRSAANRHSGSARRDTSTPLSRRSTSRWTGPASISRARSAASSRSSTARQRRSAGCSERISATEGCGTKEMRACSAGASAPRRERSSGSLSSACSARLTAHSSRATPGKIDKRRGGLEVAQEIGELGAILIEPGHARRMLAR